MQKLAEGLLKHPQVAILSDEIYSHLIFTGAEFTSFLSFPELRDRTVILDGWSKTFAMTGWRLGFSIWPRALVEHVKKLITVDHSCTSVATQMAGWRRSPGRWTRSSISAKASNTAAASWLRA
jgi:aspartate/methionine/tyrosine aminotransferase